MKSLTNKRNFNQELDQIVLPFALPVVQGKRMKKKCCKKHKKGKRCKRCPGRCR